MHWVPVSAGMTVLHGDRHETYVVPPDALHRAAGGFPRQASLGLGGHPFLAVRPAPRAPHVQRLHGRTRIRRRLRLRRGVRERAPLQRLRPDALAQPDRLVARAPHHRHRDLRHGQLAGAVQPADPRRRRVRDDRLHLRRAAHRRLPGRFADGHLLRLRPEPVAAARPLPRGARSDPARLDRPRHLRLQRPLQPAALRQHLAAAGADAASADLGARRRLDRDLAVVRRDGLRLLLPVLLRLQDRPRHDGRFLGRNGEARQGPQSVSRRLPAVRRRRREPPARDGPVWGRRRILLRQLPAHRSALRRPARLHHRGDAAHGPAKPGRQGRVLLRQVQQARARDGCHRRSRLRHHRLAGRGGGAVARGRGESQRRQPDAAAAVRQHEQGTDQVTTRACSPIR